MKQQIKKFLSLDSNDIRHELEQAGFLPANGATRVCCNCEKQAVFDVDTAIGTRSFCSEKCYAEYNGLEVMDDPNFYGMMLITRKPIETVYEVHLWTREIEGKKLGEFDEFFKFKNEESARKLYNQITDYTYKILMQYDGDEGDVLLEYDLPDNAIYIGASCTETTKVVVLDKEYPPDTEVYFVHGYNDLLDYMDEWCECDNEGHCRLFLQKLDAEKGVFTAEFSKAVSKILAVSREMEKVAEMQGRMDFLHTLKLIPSLILKHVTSNQSLYV